MEPYRRTRSIEHERQSVEASLRRFLRQSGCTTERKRREAIDYAATMPLTDQQQLVRAVAIERAVSNAEDEVLAHIAVMFAPVTPLFAEAAE